MYRPSPAATGLQSEWTESEPRKYARAPNALPARLTWAVIEGLTDDQLEARLYPAAHPSAAPARPVPDWAAERLLIAFTRE